MDDFIRWLEKVWCIITLGHEYEVETLHTHYDPDRKVYVFRNRCVKCGEWDKWEVPAENILPELVRNEVDFDD